MNDAEWPAPEPTTPREPERRTTPLPRVEDLPIAEQGYDREKVRQAFDAFYRHAAQLDATLSTLEAVEVFQRTSAELRAELRNIRGSGWTVQSWQGGTGYAGGGGSRGRVSEWTLPPSFPRLALEFGFLIAIGVVAGVAGWSALTIVLVMGLALAVVLLLEWVAARERAIPRAAAPAAAPDLDREEPAELPVGEGWVAQEEGPEALTMLDNEVVEVVADAEPGPEPEEAVPEVAEPEERSRRKRRPCSRSRSWSPSRSPSRRRSRRKPSRKPTCHRSRPRSWNPSRSPSRKLSRSPSSKRMSPSRGSSSWSRRRSGQGVSASSVAAAQRS